MRMHSATCLVAEGRKFTQNSSRIVSYGVVSDETRIREGRCVYCGATRPVTKPICPQCGHTWIDTKVGEQLPPLTPEIVAASKEERAALAATAVPTEPAKERRRPWGLLVGAALALIVIVVAFSGLFGGSDEEDPVAAASTTTTTTVASTTVPPTTSTTTTTAAPTTTTTSTTTTTTTTTTLAPIEPEGSPVAVADLTLGAFSLGPFSLDADAAYLGRLVASLGQPDSGDEAGIELGICEGDNGFAYTWDGFTAIFRVDEDRQVLVGYQLNATGSDHPTQSMTSRSGLELGHTIETLNAIYLQSGVAFENIDGTSHFILLRSGDATTLLWGPVTSTEPSGVIEGIYSPLACDGGPHGTS